MSPESPPTLSVCQPTPRPSKPLLPNIEITPVGPDTLPAYRRLITTLLPIRYPDKFYKDSVANTTSSSLALCAVWRHSPENRRQGETENVPEPTVVGGIQCRLEPLPIPPTESTPVRSMQTVYIQTLAVLSPYRSLGIATALLDTIITTAITYYSNTTDNVTEIYAHVWEANEEALGWYVKKGFTVENAVLEGYYRKLRPTGARVVRRRLGVGDWLRARDLKADEDMEINEAVGSTSISNEIDKKANG